MAGPDGREWELPPLPFTLVGESPLSSLRLAWVDHWKGTHATDETRAAPAGFDVTHVTDIGYAVFIAEIAPSLPPESGKPVPSVIDYLTLLDERNRATRTLDEFLAGYDAFILPVSSGPANPYDASLQPGRDNGEVRFGSPTMPFNLTGHPAIVVPYTRSSEGLPIGIQIVGRRWEDAELLAVTKAITRVTGPFQSPPGY